jgi:hypothetical protein
MKPPPLHGSHGALSAHRRNHERPCQLCRDYWAGYMAERRATTARRAWLRRTRAEALTRLALTHPDSYAAILNQVRNPRHATPSPHRVQLPPVPQPRRRGRPLHPAPAARPVGQRSNHPPRHTRVGSNPGAHPPP